MIIHNNSLLPQLQEQYKKYNGTFKRINVFGILDETSQDQDIWNDYVGLNIDNDVWIWKGTCNPGKHYTDTKQGGAAHMIYGYQDNIWCIDTHAADNPAFAHKALCNRQEYGCKPTTVWRDINKDYTQEDNDPVQTGYYGVNCHRASFVSNVATIGLYSEGCIVTNDHNDFQWFIDTLSATSEVQAAPRFLFGFLLTKITEWKLS